MPLGWLKPCVTLQAEVYSSPPLPGRACQRSAGLFKSPAALALAGVKVIEVRALQITEYTARPAGGHIPTQKPNSTTLPREDRGAGGKGLREWGLEICPKSPLLPTS